MTRAEERRLAIRLARGEAVTLPRKGKPMSRGEAKRLAYQLAREAGLDCDTAHVVSQNTASIHHEEFTDREVRDFIRQEIQRHAQP